MAQLMRFKRLCAWGLYLTSHNAYYWTMDFKAHRQCAGLSIADCSELFEVSRRTVRNWENSKHKPPKAVFLCLEWRDKGLSLISPCWRDFRVLRDCIVSGDGDFVYPHEIRSIRYLYLAAGLNRTKNLLGNAGDS